LPFTPVCPPQLEVVKGPLLGGRVQCGKRLAAEMHPMQAHTRACKGCILWMCDVHGCAYGLCKCVAVQLRVCNTQDAFVTVAPPCNLNHVVFKAAVLGHSCWCRHNVCLPHHTSGLSETPSVPTELQCMLPMSEYSHSIQINLNYKLNFNTRKQHRKATLSNLNACAATQKPTKHCWHPPSGMETDMKNVSAVPTPSGVPTLLNPGSP
jgi:hypothetical protein